MEETDNGGSRGEYSSNAMIAAAIMCEQTTVVSWEKMNELRVSFIKSEVERKCLRDQLDMEEERKLMCRINTANEIKIAVAKELAVKEKERADKVEAMAKTLVDQTEAAAKEQIEREKEHAELAKAVAKEQMEREKERADRAEAAAKEQMEREKEHAERARAVAKEQVEREKELAMRTAEAEKLQQTTVFLQEKAALELKVKEMEAKAKDMELANLRMQLELEKTRNSANGGGGKPSRKRAPETEDNNGGVEAVNAIPRGSDGNPRNYWLVAYEGSVEKLTFDTLQPLLPTISKVVSARFNDHWFALLHFSPRIRCAPIAKVMVCKMGLAGSAWVEAFGGCKTSVDIDIPECDEHSPLHLSIIAYMKAAHQPFPMLLIKE